VLPAALGGRPNIGGYACYLDFEQICASSMPDTAGFHITGNPLHICLCCHPLFGDVNQRKGGKRNNLSQTCKHELAETVFNSISYS